MQQLIVDTDPGEDDVLAILTAVAHPTTQIDAITVAAGNVGLDHTLNNVGVLLELLEIDVPFYAGCQRPFVQAGPDAAYAHGEDGLGNTDLRSTRQPQPTHASIELVRRAKAEPGALTLVTLGPLTNIATALKLEPNLPNLLKRIVMMGGAVTAQGNINRTAEFNIYADPEAAFVVFEGWAATGREIELADWELTTRHGIPLAERNRWWELDNKKSRFFKKISAYSDQFIEAERGRSIQFYADPVAMVVALEPDLVTQSEHRFVTVGLEGQHTRGQTVVDWDGVLKRPSNTKIITKINQARLLELIKAGLS